MSNSKFQSNRDRELLQELGVSLEDKTQATHTTVQERVLGGFEAISRFVCRHGRLPDAGEEREIFERLYAVRLESLRRSEEYKDLLAPHDNQCLLDGGYKESLDEIRKMSEEQKLRELGVERSHAEITELKHVRPYEERKAAEDVANRQKCLDFHKFEPLFMEVKQDLHTGMRKSRKFEHRSEIEAGRFFVVGRQRAYVAHKGEEFLAEHGHTDARLRVIFENGTESNLLMRSLQRALNKDPHGQRITEKERKAGPLFSDKLEEGDQLSATIYVLRSKSDIPYVAMRRDLVHKIGVTHTDIRKRIASAHLQATYLMAGVDVVAEYNLYNNVSGRVLERLIHTVFEDAQLDVIVEDHFGRKVKPQEWFEVPRSVIDEAVEKIKEGTIGQYVYDKDSRTLRLRSEAKS